MDNKEIYNKFKQWKYYIVIGVVSIIALFILPLLGTSADLNWNIPTTTAGWIVYITSKLLVALVSFLIFHCFTLQAEINVQDDKRYNEAIELLAKVTNSDTERIRSPQEYFREVYGKKGLMIFITSIIGAVGLTQAVLTFDLVQMFTYFITILGGVIAGLIQMSDTERFWTTEYLKYAKRTKEMERAALETAKKEHIEQEENMRGNNDNN